MASKVTDKSGALMGHTFSGSRAKLRAVRRHAEHFRQLMDQYIDNNKNALTVEVRPPSLDQIICAELSQVPEDLSVSIGEIAYHMRSALDILACDLATFSGCTDLKGVYFPITIDKVDFSNKTTQNKISKLHPNLQKMICDIEPHGSHIFVGLNALANADRHRNLVEAVPVMHDMDMRAIVDEKFSRLDLMIRRPTFNDSGKIDLAKIPPGQPVVGIGIKLHCRVVFKIEPLVNLPVPETLTAMGQAVEQTIDAFEKYCFEK